LEVLITLCSLTERSEEFLDICQDLEEDSQLLFIEVADQFILIDQPAQKKPTVKFSVTGLSWSKLK